MLSTRKKRVQNHRFSSIYQKKWCCVAKSRLNSEDRKMFLGRDRIWAQDYLWHSLVGKYAQWHKKHEEFSYALNTSLKGGHRLAHMRDRMDFWGHRHTGAWSTLIKLFLVNLHGGSSQRWKQAKGRLAVSYRHALTTQLNRPTPI